jgi:hypothetical protein
VARRILRRPFHLANAMGTARRAIFHRPALRLVTVRLAVIVLAAGFASVSWLEAGRAQGSARRAITPATATKAYGDWLQTQFPGAKGYWTCPLNEFEKVAGGGTVCHAEVHVKGVWHKLSTVADISRVPVSFLGRLGSFESSDRVWRRRWSSYSSRPIRGFSTPGTASVNTPFYDWAFIAGAAYEGWKNNRTLIRVWGYDGPSRGLEKFYSFMCRVQVSLVTCTNALGDAMRYKPPTVRVPSAVTPGKHLTVRVSGFPAHSRVRIQFGVDYKPPQNCCASYPTPPVGKPGFLLNATGSAVFNVTMSSAYATCTSSACSDPGLMAWKHRQRIYVAVFTDSTVGPRAAFARAVTHVT